jgi:hypothetical protein
MSQSAFVKGHYIQDNFRFIQGSARLLHASKESYLLLKVDITRASNSIAWPFLMEIMQYMGFPLT